MTKRIKLAMHLSSKKINKVEKIIENKIKDDYTKYLQKPQEYRDMVLKRMYKDTKYAHESPEKLREIMRKQFAGLKKVIEGSEWVYTQDGLDNLDIPKETVEAPWPTLK